MLRAGDRVLIRRPRTVDERSQPPTWTNSMDLYDNTIHTVSRFTLPNGWIRMELVHYNFREEWLSLLGAGQEAGEEIDDECGCLSDIK